MDRELVVSAQHGDRVAFMDLIRARVDRLFAIARRILRDVHRAEDALQDALVIAWRDLPSLRDPDRFDYWLQRVLTNMCIEHARRDRRRYAKLEVLFDDHAARDELAGVVDRDVVDRAFRRLKAGNARSSFCAITSDTSPPRSPKCSASREARSALVFITPTAPCAPQSRRTHGPAASEVSPHEPQSRRRPRATRLLRG